ncbi:H-type lectin domain-containing protein [Madurella fahalii]|uniref:H-type lectin domain-containing protein n=1 Tax=Madurella fahalii TaxID=1157608 RepID=A0ABQ0GKQ5_9PEZI
MSVLVSKDVEPLEPPKSLERLHLTWPDDCVWVGADSHPDCINDEEMVHGEGPGLKDQGGQRKRLFFRPQVTVNVYSTGGSGSGAGGSGTGAGGSGTSGAATINSNGLGIGADPISSMASQLESLSQKVEQLSSLTSCLSSSSSRQRTVIESGRWNTMEVRPWQKPRHMTEGRISFGKRFNSIPTVMVSMDSADVSHNTNFRVKVYATDIDLTGFTVHADSWGNTRLYSCGVSWMAVGE